MWQGRILHTRGIKKYHCINRCPARVELSQAFSDDCGSYLLPFET